MRVAIITASWLTVLTITVALLSVAPDFQRLPPGGPAVAYIGLVLAWGFVGVGTFAWLRRPDNRTGMLMTLAGLGVTLSGLQLLHSDLLWALGAMTDAVAVSLLLHLLLAFPSGRLGGRAERRVAALAYTSAVAQPLRVLVSPCDGVCPDTDNPLLIADLPVLADILALIQGLTAIAAVTLTLWLLIRRWRRSSPAQRRGLDPVLLYGALILLAGLGTVVTTAVGTAEKASQLAFIGCFALFPVAFLAGLVRTHFFHTTTMARLIEQLAADRDVRDALADALGDPSLDVAYWLPDRGYVDRGGHPVEPDGREVSEIDHEGRRVGALLHAPVLMETPDLVFEAAAAAGLAMENARLEVELRAKLEALRASRARLVEAGDAERRRLGRDLHDGAQQRLVAMMIELQLARESFDKDPDTARELIDSAFANAQAAVGELRDLASGIHPAVLSQRGLEAGLESLASRAPIPVEIDSDLQERFPLPVETAAYFVVAEALTNVAKYAQATYVAVTVRRENGCALLDVRDDGVGGANVGGGSGLRGLEDRVGALDGTLEVSSPPGAGTLIRARIPLG
jgi:signal transduction histidine kinase